MHTIGYSPGTKNVRTLVRKAMQDHPEAIYVTGFEKTYFGLLRMLRVMGFEGTVLTGTPFSNPVAQKMVGDAADGVIFVGTQVVLSKPDSINTQKLQERYKEKYNRPIMHFTTLSYDALSVLEYLVRENTPLTQETFKQVSPWKGIAYEMEFLREGECRIPTFAMEHLSGQNLKIK